MIAHFLLILLFAALAVMVARRGRPWLAALMLLVALIALVGLFLAP